MSVLLDVWAPSSKRACLMLGDGGVVTMTPDPGRPGWFVATAPLAHGTDYEVSLDDGVHPDPRARWAPHGVHGSSRVLDPDTFSWNDSSWRGRPLGTDSVVYELHVGTFTATATLDGAIERLGHLAQLGITHVELLPLAAFDGTRGWGYDGVALDAVHEPYGGPEALVRFVDAAHGLGLAVLLDVVHNHLGPSGNRWSHFGPFLTDAHTTPWGPAVNLDAPGSDDVRSILVGSALRWLEDFHLDGLRLDAVHELRDSRAVPLLEELSIAVEQLSASLGRSLVLVAESDRNDPRTVTAVRDGGLGMTAQWDDDVHHALHWLLTGQSDGYYADFASCEAVAHAVERGFLHDGRWSSFRGRTHGRPIDLDRTPAHAFVVALQTHDQVGNRARGERLSQLAGADRLAAGAALLLSLPYTPMLFMGEEWGASTPWQYFTSFEDRALAAAVTHGRRSEFAEHGWSGAEVPDPQDPATYERSVLDWSELADARAARLLRWYQALIRWRRADLAHAPQPVTSWHEEPGATAAWWTVTRGRFAVAVNLADASVDVDLRSRSAVDVRLSWSGDHDVLTDEVGRSASVRLGAGESVVLKAAGGWA
jgi:maltooligosyltrehalose trehalohydrolase